MHTLPTSAGARLVSARRPLVIPTDPAAALIFAREADRHADHMLAHGRSEQADRLAHAACEARARANGGRA